METRKPLPTRGQPLTTDVAVNTVEAPAPVRAQAPQPDYSVREKIEFENVPSPPCEVEKTATKTFNDHGDNLIEFVSRHLEKMEAALLFEGTKQPSFYQLNEALCSYEGILLSLISMYEDQRFQAKQSKEVYDIWLAEKFIDVRDRENQKDLAAAKWLSAAEIEKKVIVENKEEYSRIRANVILNESKESTLRRLIDGWNAYQFLLSNLCKNAQAELGASTRSLDSDDGTGQSSY